MCSIIDFMIPVHSNVKIVCLRRALITLGYLTPTQFPLKFGELHNKNFSTEEFPTFQQDTNYDESL